VVEDKSRQVHTCGRGKLRLARCDHLLTEELRPMAMSDLLLAVDDSTLPGDIDRAGILRFECSYDAFQLLKLKAAKPV
jgi:hypothetical protein